MTTTDPVPSPTNPIPVGLYPFSSDYTYHTILSCKNHPNLRWSSKDPFARSIFYRGTDVDLTNGGPTRSEPECDCPFPDMTVVYDQENTRWRVP